MSIEIIIWPLFEVGSWCKNGTIEHLTDVELREKVVDRFNLFSKEVSHMVDSSQHMYIKFALTAYLDELILKSNWSYIGDWRRNTLQHMFYNEQAAGKVFFDKLDEIRKKGEEYNCVLQIYYICLCLGFEGQYVLRDKDKLHLLKDTIKNQIKHNFVKSEKNEFLSVNREDQKHKLLQPRKISYGGLLIACVCFFLMYHGLYVSISHTNNKIIDNLTSYKNVADHN